MILRGIELAGEIERSPFLFQAQNGRSFLGILVTFRKVYILVKRVVVLIRFKKKASDYLWGW